MTGRYEKLQSLVGLAKEQSSDKRRALLREVTDLFLEDPASLKDGEQSAFGDVIGKLAFQLEMKVRQNLAERMATIAEAPPDLIKSLARDDILVAKPVLEQSAALRPEDLLEIVKTHSQEHLLAVSLRPEVDEAVSDVLVERGDDTVVETLVRNEGAKFSRSTQAAIVERAKDNDALHEPLVNRRDVAPDLMHQMYFIVNSALKEHIMANTADMDESTVDRLLEEARAEAAQDFADEEKHLSDAERKILDLERRGKLNESYLLSLLGRNEMPEFTAAFARLCEMDVKTARRILFKGDGEAIAIACRATGISRTTVGNLISGVKADDGTARNNLAELLALYDQVPEMSAKRAMRFWRTREQTLQNKNSVINR